MSIKSQVSPEDWKILFNAMSAASSYVSIASGKGLETLKELLSASKFAAELVKKESGSGYGELVDELLDNMKGMSLDDAKEATIIYESKDIDGIRAELKQIVLSAAAIVANLPGEDGFKKWIMDTAREVAETKTGGFLGIGAKSVVDSEEQVALNELAGLLGL